jgi:hypothetical protein
MTDVISVSCGSRRNGGFPLHFWSFSTRWTGTKLLVVPHYDAAERVIVAIMPLVPYPGRGTSPFVR